MTEINIYRSRIGLFDQRSLCRKSLQKSKMDNYKFKNYMECAAWKFMMISLFLP